MLGELRSTEGNPFRAPGSTPVELVDNDPLEQPLDTQLRTSAMGPGWDPTTAEIVIDAYAVAEVNDVDLLGRSHGHHRANSWPSLGRFHDVSGQKLMALDSPERRQSAAARESDTR